MALLHSCLLSLAQCITNPISAKSSEIHLFYVFLGLPTDLPSAFNLPKTPCTVIPCSLYMSKQCTFHSEYFLKSLSLHLLATSSPDTTACHLILALYLSILRSFAFHTSIDFLVRVLVSAPCSITDLIHAFYTPVLLRGMLQFTSRLATSLHFCCHFHSVSSPLPPVNLKHL